MGFFNDERFTWLIYTFLQYFEDWKHSIAERSGQFTANARVNMFISWQIYEGVKITVHSAIELIQYLQYLTERFCQDPLENYFGRQIAMGHRKDNPSLRDFGYNDNTFLQPNCLDRLLEIVTMMIPKWRLCLAALGTNNSPHRSHA